MRVYHNPTTGHVIVDTGNDELIHAAFPPPQDPLAAARRLIDTYNADKNDVTIASYVGPIAPDEGTPSPEPTTPPLTDGPTQAPDGTPTNP